MKLKRLFTITAFTALAIVTVVFALFLVDFYLDQQRAERAERAERARRAERAERARRAERAERAKATRNYGPEAESVAEAAIKIAAEAEAEAKAARIVANKAPATDVDHYKGEIRYGKPHGKGVLGIMDEDARRHAFRRAWRLSADKMAKHAWGLRAEYVVYEGEWSEGEPHGKGVIRRVAVGQQFATIVELKSAGDAYAGEWSEGNPHGKGVIRFANGATYEGEWVRTGGRTGKGVYRWANGDSWAGEFQNDKRYGKGIYRFKGGKAEIECFAGDSAVNCKRLETYYWRRKFGDISVD